MQDFSSTVTCSPSFSFYASGEFAAAAVKVSRENQSYNITDHHSDKVESVNDEDPDFEFETAPLHEETFVHFPTFTPVSIDTVLMRNKTDDDVAADAENIPGNLSLGGRWSTPPSPLWSDSEELDNFSGNCLWSPLRSPAAGGGHSKISRRCRLKIFLTRSQSDGAVSFPGASKRCRLKDFLTRSHSDGSKKTSSTALKGKNKTASYKPPVNNGEGDKRRKSYLPYRQDLIGVFTGMRRLRH